MLQKKYLNRYRSFRSSLASLQKARQRDLTDDFVISGTVQKFCLTFDITWKVMKDVIVGYHKVVSFASGSPRETLRMAGQLGLISGDVWMKMLLDRNELTHDYDGSLARNSVRRIIDLYLPLLEQFSATASEYMKKMEEDDDL
jgi:nucleotidyltransferase substrate binding protein (TIGR01987 family)